MFLTACGEPEAIFVDRPTPVDVPTALRGPCAKPETPRRDTTLHAIGSLLIDYDEALGCANGKIIARDAILADAEARAADRVAL